MIPLRQRTEKVVVRAPRVLCFGLDRDLLWSRGAVIGGRFEVLTADSLEGFGRVPPEPEVDVLVLCHTLSDELCHAAAAMARFRWPKVKIITLFSGRRGCASVNADTEVKALEGPEHLLEAIEAASTASGDRQTSHRRAS